MKLPVTSTEDALNLQRQHISALSQRALAQAVQARQMSSVARERNRQVMERAARLLLAKPVVPVREDR